MDKELHAVYLARGDEGFDEVSGWRGEDVNPKGHIKWWVWPACATVLSAFLAFQLWWQWTEPNPPQFPHNDGKAYAELKWDPVGHDFARDAIFSIDITNAAHSETANAIYVNPGWDCVFAWKDRLGYEHCIDESGKHTLTFISDYYEAMDGSDTIDGILINTIRH